MADFNQEQLDVLGTSAINSTFTLMGYCRPYINTADKKPIWDGDLFVYKSKLDFSKSNLDFTLPLQVKTSFHAKRNFPKQARHKAYVNDLEAYLEDCGVLFINVLVQTDGSSQIYCGYLSKTKIKDYLLKAKNHQSITISLSRLPKTFKDFYDELFTLHLQRKLNSISLDELINHKNPRFSFRVNHVPNNTDIMLHVANNPVDVLVECEGFSDPFYVGNCRAFLKFSQIIEQPISVDGVIYYKNYSRTPDGNSYIVNFGKSLSIKIVQDSTNLEKLDVVMTVTISHDGTITDITNELKFIVSSFEKRGFNIGDKWYSFPMCNSDTSKALNTWKDMLMFWQDVHKLMDLLGIQESLNINQLSNQNYKDLQILIDAFLYDKRVIGETQKNYTVNFSIGNINILIFAEHQDGYYFKFRNIYQGFLCSILKNGEHQIISPFMIPYRPDLDHIPDNIPLSILEQSYNDVLKLNPNIFDYAIENLLSMLKAFDKTKRNIHLEAAKILSLWLLNQVNDKKMLQICKLNYLQTIYRSRKFDNSELDELAIITEESSDKAIRLAANALLGNSAIVKHIWPTLKKSVQKDLALRPIYNIITQYL